MSLSSNKIKLFLLLFFISYVLKATEYDKDIINPFKDNKVVRTLDYREYKREEISKEFFYFRRWEIITFGAFPIIFIFSNLVYDISRYAYFYSQKDPNISNYSPFSASKKEYNVVENLSLLGASFGVSTIIAFIDFLIVRKKIKNGVYEQQFRY